MGSFADGMRMGQGAYNSAMDREQQAKDNERRDRLDAQAAESHRQSIARGDLEIGGLRRVNDATDNLTALSRVGARNQQNFNANNADFDSALAASDAGLALPAYKTPLPDFRPATERDYTNAARGLAAARGDATGVLGAGERLRQLDVRDIGDKAAKMSVGDIEAMLPDLNKNTSQYPMLYTGKSAGGKGKSSSYEFLTMDGNGAPGNKFTLNESQIRQLAHAHLLGDGGFGNESMAALTGAHKDIGDHVAKWNSALSGVVGTNNTARHNSNTDAYHDRMAGATEAHYKNQSAALAAQAPVPLNPEAQKDLSELYAKLKTVKGNDAQGQIINQINARLASEQTFGRGHNMRFVPHPAAEARPQVPFKDFMEISGNTVLPSVGANGKPMKLSEASPAVQGDHYRKFLEATSGQAGGGGGGGGFAAVDVTSPSRSGLPSQASQVDTKRNEPGYTIAPASVTGLPPAPGTRPVRAALEPFADFRNRTTDWDTSSQAFQQGLEGASREAERQRILSTRPDLQQLGRGFR